MEWSYTVHRESPLSALVHLPIRTQLAQIYAGRSSIHYGILCKPLRNHWGCWMRRIQRSAVSDSRRNPHQDFQRNARFAHQTRRQGRTRAPHAQLHLRPIALADAELMGGFGLAEVIGASVFHEAAVRPSFALPFHDRDRIRPSGLETQQEKLKIIRVSSPAVNMLHVLDLASRVSA